MQHKAAGAVKYVKSVKSALLHYNTVNTRTILKSRHMLQIGDRFTTDDERSQHCNRSAEILYGRPHPSDLHSLLSAAEQGNAFPRMPSSAADSSRAAERLEILLLNVCCWQGSLLRQGIMRAPLVLRRSTQVLVQPAGTHEDLVLARRKAELVTGNYSSTSSGHEDNPGRRICTLRKQRSIGLMRSFQGNKPYEYHGGCLTSGVQPNRIRTSYRR